MTRDEPRLGVPGEADGDDVRRAVRSQRRQRREVPLGEELRPGSGSASGSRAMPAGYGSRCVAAARRGRAGAWTPASPERTRATTSHAPAAGPCSRGSAARLRMREGDVDVLLPFDEVVGALGHRGEQHVPVSSWSTWTASSVDGPAGRLRPAVPADQRPDAQPLRAAGPRGPQGPEPAAGRPVPRGRGALRPRRPPPRRGDAGARPRLRLRPRHRRAHGRDPRCGPAAVRPAAQGPRAAVPRARAAAGRAVRAHPAARARGLGPAGRGDRGLGLPSHAGARRAAGPRRGGPGVVLGGVRAGAVDAARGRPAPGDGALDAQTYLRFAKDRYLVLRTHRWDDEVVERLALLEGRRRRD